MRRQTDRRSHKFQLSVFGALIFHPAVAFLLLTLFHGGHCQVLDQPQPIVVMVGDNITLPCHVKPAINAFEEMMTWSRHDLDPKFVHVRRSGQDRPQDQNPSYRGRTSVSIDGLKQGDASLKLSKVKLSDEGTYGCTIPRFKTQSSVQLVVDAVIKITKVDSGVLQCESKGWYPEPEVFWLDGEGNLLSAGPTETVRGPDDLYTVSSRVTVEKRHSNNFTCRVQQNNINQTRETHIIVSDDFFTDSSRSSASTIIGATVGIIFILAVIFVVWKWRQNKLHYKQLPTENKTNNVLVQGEWQMKDVRQEREMSEANDAPCQAEEEGQQDKYKDKNNEGQNTAPIQDDIKPQPLIDGKTDQLPAAHSNVDKKDEDRETLSIDNKKADQGPTEGERQQEAQQAGGETKDNSDQTRSEENDLSCQAEREGQQDKNRYRRDDGENTTPKRDETISQLSVNGQTNQPQARKTDLDEKDAKPKPKNNKTTDEIPTEVETEHGQQEGRETNKNLDQTESEEKEASCPAKKEGRQDKNMDGRVGEENLREPTKDNTKPQSPADGQAGLLPTTKEQSDMGKKDEGKETKSVNTEKENQDGERQEEEEKEEEDEEGKTLSIDNKKADKGPTGGGKQKDAPQAGTKTNDHLDQTRSAEYEVSCPAEEGGQQDNNDGKDGGKTITAIQDNTKPQPPVDGQTDQHLAEDVKSNEENKEKMEQRGLPGQTGGETHGE